jgi:enamine deaminase RidA (YjgF/YER057c/UK114 family)
MFDPIMRPDIGACAEVSLEEESFRIDFITMKCDAPEVGGAAGDSLRGNHITVMERIVPPDLRGPAGAGGTARWGQRVSVRAFLKDDSAMSLKTGHGVRISADGIDIFFSRPFICAERDAAEFRRCFDDMDAGLACAGMGSADIARTWIYMSDILADYDRLNCARDAWFAERFAGGKGFIPASTGIQGRFYEGAVMSLEFCAFAGGRVTLQRVKSPMQDEALSYGKLFSRAVKVSLPRNDLLFISGTASIDRQGRSAHVGCLEGQLRLTCDVMAAILGDNRADFGHIAHSILYLKDRALPDCCADILSSAGFPVERALLVCGTDVCRPELLCEIEAVAVIPRECC